MLRKKITKQDRLPRWVSFTIVIAIIISVSVVGYVLRSEERAQPIGDYYDRKMSEPIDQNLEKGILPVAYGSEKMYMNWTIDDPPEGDEPVIVRIHDNSTGNRIIHCTHTTMCPYPTNAMFHILSQYEMYTPYTLVNIVLHPSNITVFNGTIGQLH